MYGDAIVQGVALLVGDGSTGGPALACGCGKVALGAKQFISLAAGGFEGGCGPASIAVSPSEVFGADLAMAVPRFATAVVTGRARSRSQSGLCFVL